MSGIKSPERNSQGDIYRVVYTFKMPNIVSKDFMRDFHEVCRRFDKPLKRRVERELTRHFNSRNFLPAGYVKDIAIEFTHAKREEINMELEPSSELGLALGPWSRGRHHMNYLWLVYQPERFPVGIVTNVHLEENLITCAASEESKIYGSIPKEEYTLREIHNAIRYFRAVQKFEPLGEGYRELEVKQIVYFGGIQ